MPVRAPVARLGMEPTGLMGLHLGAKADGCTRHPTVTGHPGRALPDRQRAKGLVYLGLPGDADADTGTGTGWDAQRGFDPSAGANVNQNGLRVD